MTPKATTPTRKEIHDAAMKSVDNLNPIDRQTLRRFMGVPWREQVALLTPPQRRMYVKECIHIITANPDLTIEFLNWVNRESANG